MHRFEDEVVVIFGGSSGIGKESGYLFANQGAQVLLVARRQEGLQDVVRDIRWFGGKAEFLTADVTDDAAMQELALTIESTYGRVDVLIYSAGVFHLSPVETLDLDTARHAMDINYWGALHVTKAFLPLIRKGRRKSLVYLSSLSVPCTPAFFTAYAATKHALYGFTLSLRQELAPEGIHVTIISPGPVDTPLIEGHLHREMYQLPLGIPVFTPESVAKGILIAVLKKKRELVLPRRLGIAARLSRTFPILLEAYYRWTIPGWQQGMASHIEARRNLSTTSQDVDLHAAEISEQHELQTE